jgi:hypothetical protein
MVPPRQQIPPVHANPEGQAELVLQLNGQSLL